jgi:hypothetical protein
MPTDVAKAKEIWDEGGSLGKDEGFSAFFNGSNQGLVISR